MAPTPVEFRRRVAIVAGLALVVRVVYVVLMKRHDALVGDEPYFHLTGNWLAEGFGFTARPHSGIPSALHPPLFSLLLAPVSWVASGTGVVAQRVAGALIGVATVVVVAYLGREVAGDRVGIIAAVLAAVSPTLWVNDGILMSESLAALVVAVALLLAYRYLRAPSLRLAVALGVTCGLAALTRGELALLLLVLALPVVALGGARAAGPRRSAAAACVVVSAVAVVLPWVLYNRSRFEQPVEVSTNLGGTLCGANNPLTYSGSELGLWDRGACPVPSTRPADQSVLNGFWTTSSVDYARDHASRLPLVALVRLARITGVYAPGQMVAFEAATGARPRAVSWAVYVVSWLLLACGGYGVVVLRRRGRPIAPLLAMIGMVLVVAMLLHGDVRYRVPAEVAMVVLAAAGIDGLMTVRARVPAV